MSANAHSSERDLLHAAEHPPEGEECYACGGKGYILWHQTYACPACDGLGYIVPDGDALADEAGDFRYDQEIEMELTK